MAAIIFPTSPTLNQEFTANGRTWFWTGDVWGTLPSAGLQGLTGPQGLTGIQGIQGLPAGSNVEFKPITGTYYFVKGDVGKILLFTSPGQLVVQAGVFAVGDVLNIINISNSQPIIWNEGYTLPTIRSGANTSQTPYVRAFGSAAAIICTPSTTPGDEFWVVGDVV